MPDPQQKTIELRCHVLQVRFHRDNYAVCLCRTKDIIPDDASSNVLTLTDEKAFIAAGYGLKTVIGQELTITGTWEYNKKYSTTQFKVQDCMDYVGTGHDAIVEYLSSGILKGVRRAMAEKIYAMFGDDTINILENDPRQLLLVSGIREKKLSGIISSFIKNQDMHLLTRLLSPYGISYRTIARIRKALGEGAAAIVRGNPYTLCKITGIDFLTADDIALKMGTPPDSYTRISGAILYTMRKAMRADGHVYILRNKLIEGCIGKGGVLSSKNGSDPIDTASVEQALERMLDEGELVQPKLSIEGIEPDTLFLPAFLTYETLSAHAVTTLLMSPQPPDFPNGWSQILLEIQEETGITLAETQYAAALMALSSQFSIITGGPGSGKTTSLLIITKSLLRAKPGLNLVLAAPTGRAARRMAEQTGMPAQTIHKLLGLKPEDHTDFSAPCQSYLEADFLIIDEASMMDAALFAELLYRIMPGTKVLILGDSDQLPSVGPGNVLRELLSIPKIIPQTRLDKVFRQGSDSIIPVNAAKIRAGDSELIYSKEQFHLQYCKNEAAGASMMEKLMKRLAELQETETAQILCPMKRRGETSTRNLNILLHDIVNPPSEKKKEITIAGILFRVGDKVMQTKNTEEVSNGDMGYIVYAAGESLTNPGDSTSDVVLKVQFDSTEDPVEYTYEAALELEPATAITIHKAQGGEFERVIIPIFRSMGFFLRRNLFYTAVTRARKQVVIISDGESIETAIQKEDTSKRSTALSCLIRHCYNDPNNGAELIEQNKPSPEIKGAIDVAYTLLDES